MYIFKLSSPLFIHSNMKNEYERKYKNLFYNSVVSNNKTKLRSFNMTHAEVWYAIDAFASEHHVSCSGLAKRSGLDATTFNKSKRWSKYGQPRWPSTNSIAKILESTGASISDFTKYFSTPTSAAQQAV